MTYETADNNPPIATPTFPFFQWSPAAWDAVPRFACEADIPSSNASVSARGAASCESTWVGVTLSGASNVGFFVAPYAARAPVDVYYTLDGSAPSTSANKYVKPFSIPAAAATVRVQSFDRATGAPVAIETSAAVLVK
jgi:hypothetical protein